MAVALQHHYSGLSRNTYLLAAASLFADISTEMLYPILPVFPTQTLKASGSVVGLVEGFAQATQNIVQGLSGALSDKLQKRKPVAVAGPDELRASGVGRYSTTVGLLELAASAVAGLLWDELGQVTVVLLPRDLRDHRLPRPADVGLPAPVQFAKMT